MQLTILRHPVRRRRADRTVLLWRAGVLVAFALFWTVPAIALASSPLRLDEQGYLRELDRWTSIVESARNGQSVDVPTDVPSEWIVTVQGTEHHVSTSFLGKDLFNAKEADAVLQHLKQLREGVSTSQTVSPSSDRAVASRILERREYRRVHVPGADESLRDRINAFVLRILRKIFGKAGEHIDDMRVLADFIVWGLLLAAVAAMLFWLRRALLNGTHAEMQIGGIHSEWVSARPLEEWLNDADEAASRGEYRLAVRFAYWGAISALERAGAWKPDRARTPREYLRLVRGSPHENTLGSLTRRFERVWYAKQPATEADFVDCMRGVEELTPQ